MESMAVLIAQTSAGVGRVDGDQVHLLDVGTTNLSDLIKYEALDRLDDAPVRKTVEREALTYLPPVSAPGKMIVVGLNYRDHAAEVGMDLPTVPRIHLAAGSAVIGPTDDIPLPEIAPAHVDFEGEMAVIIGASASGVSTGEAWNYIAGVTVADDVSARDVQDGSNTSISGPNVGLAKAFDGFKPLGPVLRRTDDDLRAAYPLRVRTLVDGEVRQDSTTAEMSYSVAELVSRISSYVTLRPGDVILTGTPGGVGVTTGRFLTPGQLVEVQLETIGTLRNRVVAASRRTEKCAAET